MKHVSIEVKPDSYVGLDIDITIRTNTKGFKLAILLEEKMEAFIKEYYNVIKRS